ncbi:hypothetical protein LZZ85_18460 [Terrimonas sp. NA20]|uniref:eRF1 domain-containing protein n=1 Tax=Terrimonas ginsenosidimutans TaxID=2908004 RepID=A0ABS9KVH7_9BACT|nr:hypothetical protein [Terrimonas ginsenosidimutans]MCG2616288.1 hypothetical protein [Terrimonas ginsenosidimutans]
MQTIKNHPLDKKSLTASAPAVSILMPFEPHMTSKETVAARMRKAIGLIGNELRIRYHYRTSDLILAKLKKVITELDYNKLKKSVAIYVSSLVERVIYMDIPLNEKISIGEYFDIREIIRAKKDSREILILKLDGHHTTILRYDGRSVCTMNKNTAVDIASFEKGLPEKVGNFWDANDIRGVHLDNFLRSADKSLRQLLKDYPLPVFLMGSPRLAEHFMALTSCSKNIVKIVHGDHPDISPKEVLEILAPHLMEWQSIRMRDLLNQIEDAADFNKLGVGIREVWKQAGHHNARLLIVEEHFVPAIILPNSRIDERFAEGTVARNAVDETIEMVLAAGGDVEIVPDGKLAGYHHIALIGRHAIK